MTRRSRRSGRRGSGPGARRVLMGVPSIAAILLPAAGIAYLGAVSYREDRGLVAAKLSEQFQAAVAVASALERELGRTLDAVATLGAEPKPSALDALEADHALAGFPFHIAAGGELAFPAPEPLRRPGAVSRDFLTRGPGTCPERGFEACIRAIREARRRVQRLDAARRRELGSCVSPPAEAEPTTGCQPGPRDRELARRAYTALTRFEDTGPEALLGLARLARAAGDADVARVHYRNLARRFSARVDGDGVSYRLIGDLGAAEMAAEAGALLEVYGWLLGRTYEAPPALLDRVAEHLAARLEAVGPSLPAAARRQHELDELLAFARHQVRFARLLFGEVEEIVRTAGPRMRGRAALTGSTLDRTLIYRRQADDSIVGVVVDSAMLENQAALADVDFDRLGPGIRATVARPGDAERRDGNTRILASTGFGPVMPHLSLALVNDRRLPDPLDAIVEARGRRHLAITGGLVALLVVGLLATFRGAARERELARLKSDFVSTVSHELKTPLTSIRMFGEMLQQDVAAGDREREAHYHDIIVKESQRLGLLIANLLDYSQIERGTRRYSRQAENAGELARDAVATFRRLGEERAEVELVDRTAGPPPSIDRSIDRSIDDGAAAAGSEIAPAMLIDREVVLQCLLNLLGNADKYGEPPIRVAVDATPGEVVIAVSDHGPGIAKAEQERIFREFYRAPAAQSSAVEGTGLGLALVKRHVEAQGGTVSVRSEPGRGATFSITFPRC